MSIKVGKNDQEIILEALEASRDFMELMRLAHQNQALMPTASQKLLGEFEAALAQARDLVEEALQLTRPGSKLSAFVFENTLPPTRRAVKH